MRVGIFCIMCHLSLGREKKALLISQSNNYLPKTCWLQDSAASEFLFIPLRWGDQTVVKYLN